jgi:hypothetical protein
MTEYTHFNPGDMPVETKPQRTRYIAKSLGSETLRSIQPPIPGVDKMIEAKFNGVREQIFEKFPSNFEGLDMDRVYNFFDKFGLHKASLVVINKKQKHELMEFMQNATGAEANEREHLGYYKSLLDTAFIFRDDILEQDNGAEFTESIIVHELAHGSSEHMDISAFVDSSTNSLVAERARIGQAMTFPQPANAGVQSTTGLFLEEGFADYMRGLYISGELGLPEGFIKNNIRSIKRWRRSEHVMPVLPKYVYKTGEEFSAIPSSAAATALELLTDKDPRLFPAMLDARKEVDGLRAVAARIDTIEPALYKKLRDNFNHENEFYNGLDYVRSVLK